MRNPIGLLFAVLATITFALTSAIDVRAGTMKIEEGEIFLGGSAFSTPNYQNYLRFSFGGSTRNPSSSFVFSSEQQFSVYLGFPPRPEGEFEYVVQMPYSPGSVNINGENHYPVWYSDSKWSVRMSVMTPPEFPPGPEFTVVNSAFEFSGTVYFQGARGRCLRAKGSGTAQVMFQKIENKYYFRQALLTFGPQSRSTPGAGLPEILGQSQNPAFPLGGI